MINRNLNHRAGEAIREARTIDNELTHKGGTTIVVQVVDSPEFWAGINLLCAGEYKLLPSSNPTTITLERKV